MSMRHWAEDHRVPEGPDPRDDEIAALEAELAAARERIGRLSEAYRGAESKVIRARIERFVNAREGDFTYVELDIIEQRARQELRADLHDGDLDPP